MSGISPLPQYPHIVLALSLLGEPDRYHWFLFVPDAASNSGQGTKIHVTDLPLATDPSDAWRFVAEPNNINASPSSVCAAAIVGRVPEGKSVVDIVQIAQAVPLNEVPSADVGKEPKFTCRVWIKEVIKHLHASHFLRCPDVDALEQEMRGYASVAVASIENDTFDKACLVAATTCGGEDPRGNIPRHIHPDGTIII
ncbi:hypothetical protein GLOTRDRAFT_124824 [Gloeophyllum trabeum ATCC 11539]|uniref:Uncharacterized protein n=1 Tax=Gloeophyllum trabeum (strain ATCC 11539 / FP-39264 / Madison 617) TaxID=670483 RepID=S7S569_GLOTA|nr:uncharacterized protein GLOTRDRAFT_124824 [Gloeophyllum trabeum ATCC 11539]EPQ61094.1 hypothetical protein GLOTRDRAFT_124824 [Gloeophyllum trabeum ATCC 11539]